MRVYVGKRDIKRGKRNEEEFCPIALALKRKLHKRVFVGTNDVVISDKDEYTLCDKAVEFIKKYDRRYKVKPFNAYLKKVR